MKLFKNKEKKIDVMRDKDSLSIYLFDKILETDDYFFMVKKYDPSYSEFKKTEELEVFLKSMFEKVMFFYIVSSGSSRHEMKVKSQIYIKKLELSLYLVNELVNLYYEKDNEVFLNMINKVDGFSFDKKKGLEKEISRISISINQKTTNLKIKISQFNKKYIDNAKPNTPITETAISISRTLELGYSINVKKTSVAEWIGYLNLCNKKEQNG